MGVFDRLLDYFSTTDEKLAEIIKKLDKLYYAMTGQAEKGETVVKMPERYTFAKDFVFIENAVLIAVDEEEVIIEYDVPKGYNFYLQQFMQSNVTTDMTYTLTMDNKEISLSDDVFGTYSTPFDLTANGFRKGVLIKNKFRFKAKNSTGAPVEISARIVGELEYVG